MSKNNELRVKSCNHEHVHNHPGDGHEHEHEHEHEQHHHHGHSHSAMGGHVHVTGTKLKWAFFATFVILAVEVIGGSLSGSLALLSDAGHVLTDVAV